MRWQFGAVLPPEIKTNLCEPEQEFFTKYNRILVNYMASIDTDLTEDLNPPRSLYVDVRFELLFLIFKNKGYVNYCEYSFSIS